jgi:1-acyl-sn-glycerol-3-phosphate acyltransferase
VQVVASVVFTLLFFAWTGVYAIFFSLAAPFVDFLRRMALARGYAHGVMFMLRVICRLDYRVQGLENFPFGAHVVLWKHSSSWETVAQFLIGRPAALVLKRELMWIPFFGWGLALIRSIPIDRKAGTSAINQVIETGQARLRQGIWVLVFPEGTRTPPGETRKYGLSGALLASRAGCKVVPVAHDAAWYWPRRSLIKRPGTIRVVVGKPIDAAGRDPREINAEVQKWIEETIAEIRAGR